MLTFSLASHICTPSIEVKEYNSYRIRFGFRKNEK